MAEDREFHLVESFAHRAVLRPDLVDLPVAALWRAGAPLPGAKGRGGAAVLELRPGLHGVVRDFRRGGAFGFLLARSYLDRRRPERELRLLAALRAAGVPVVEPLAALARRRWLLFHRLRLVTELVEGAVPLPAYLAAAPDQRRRAVLAAGEVIGRAFAAGLLHRDLHPDNLIARRGPDGGVQVVLLDLDRAELRRELGDDDRDAMLVRMARYLRRHAGNLPVRPAATDSLRFLKGLGMARKARRQALDRLLPRYRQALQRHGLR